MKNKRVLVHEVKYVEVYTCPNCKIMEFTKAFNACPRCLARIEWVGLKK